MSNTKITEATTVIPQAGDLLPLGRPGNTTAFNTLVSGMSLISQGEVTGAVDAVDIVLPAGYSNFILYISGLKFADPLNSYPMLMFSQDGSTFPSSGTDYEYRGTTFSALTGQTPDYGAFIADPVFSAGDDGIAATVSIWPGSADSLPWAFSFANMFNGTARFGIWAGSRITATARQQAIRIVDWTIVAAPPGSQISAGMKYKLIGLSDA